MNEHETPRGHHPAATSAQEPRSPRARALDALLVLAVLVAIALAVSGVAEDPDARPAEAVAVVNGQVIAKSEFDIVVARVSQQLGREPTPEERAEVLARLVDEELLIQRGIALGLPRSEGRLRGLLVQEAMRQALAGISAQPVGDAELAAFFARNAAYFRRPARLHARRYDLRDEAQAQGLRAALQAGGVSALAPWSGARSALLPDAPLPLAKLRELLGADAAGQLAGLAPGQSLVQQRPDGAVSVLVLVAAEDGESASLDAMHAEVESEFRRRRDEEAIAAYLQRLRAEARIVLAGDDA